MRASAETRFAGKYAIDTETGCWNWQGALSPNGYGHFFHDRARGRSNLAHRFSWELHHGAIPKGMCVCHTCDNRGCVAIVHLFLASVAENNADRHRKGRTRPGSYIPRAITENVPRDTIARFSGYQCTACNKKIGDKARWGVRPNGRVMKLCPSCWEKWKGRLTKNWKGNTLDN